MSCLLVRQIVDDDFTKFNEFVWCDAVQVIYPQLFIDPASASLQPDRDDIANLIIDDCCQRYEFQNELAV